jgi:hypothetical protein
MDCLHKKKALTHQRNKRYAKVLFLCSEKIPGILFTFPSLVARTGQKLFMFVLSHFLSSFFNDTSQPITSPH